MIRIDLFTFFLSDEDSYVLLVSLIEAAREKKVDLHNNTRLVVLRINTT